MVIEKRRLHPILLILLGIFFFCVLFRFISSIHFKLINQGNIAITKIDVIVHLIILMILILVGIILYSNFFLRRIKFNFDSNTLTIKENKKTIHFIIQDIEDFDVIKKNESKNSGLIDQDLKEIYSYISEFQNDLLGITNGLQLKIRSKNRVYVLKDINSKCFKDLMNLRDDIMRKGIR